MNAALIMVLVLGLVFFGWLGWFAWSSWSQRFSRSRVQLMVRLIESVALMILARQITAWGAVPILWFVAVGLLAVGIAGLAVRWAELPWTGQRKRRQELVSGSLTAAISVALAGLVLS